MSDDRALLEAWRAGDKDAGRRLVDAHYDAVVRFFRHKAGAGADDLVQRTFLRCTQAKERIREGTTFRAFLFGVARRVLWEHYRAKKKDAQRDPEVGESAVVDLAPGVATHAQARAERRVLVQALQRIPLELQMIIELHYWEGLGMRELGDVLGVPPGTVKSRLHRARKLLRSAIEKVEASPDARSLTISQLDAWAAAVRDADEIA